MIQATVLWTGPEVLTHHGGKVDCNTLLRCVELKIDYSGSSSIITA